MRRFRILLMSAVLVAVLGSCERQPRLVIIHTNDTHSHLEPIRSGVDAGKGGAIERAAFVDSVRNAVGEDRVLLLHAGDFSQGTSYFSELGGRLEPKIINGLRYDCVALGNHEFDNGIEDLTERLAMLQGTKVVSANIDVSQFELSKYVQPYAIIEKAGLKIGIIGLESNLSSNVSASISSRIPQLDNVEVTNRWADYLHDIEKCDMIILLSHVGYEGDQALVPNTRHIDLVVGGHSHTFVDDLIYVEDLDGRKVPIITDGCFGIEMGEVRFY